MMPHYAFLRSSVQHNDEQVICSASQNNPEQLLGIIHDRSVCQVCESSHGIKKFSLSEKIVFKKNPLCFSL